MLILNFKNKNLGIVKKFWVFVIVSAVIILAGLTDMLFIRHMNFGVEFSGTDYRIHGADEFAITDELLLTAKMYTAIIYKLCSKKFREIQDYYCNFELGGV